eukprot:gene8045-749_t
MSPPILHRLAVGVEVTTTTVAAPSYQMTKRNRNSSASGTSPSEQSKPPTKQDKKRHNKHEGAAETIYQVLVVVKQPQHPEAHTRQIDKWDFSKLKNNIEDVVTEEFFNEIDCSSEQDYSVSDFKLAILSLACLIALFACLYGYFVPHPESGVVVGPCSILYFFLMGAFVVHGAYFDHRDVVAAVQKNGSKLFIRIYWERYNPNVHVVALRQAKNAPKPALLQEKFACVGDFVYEDGEISRDAVRNFLKVWNMHSQ